MRGRGDYSIIVSRFAEAPARRYRVSRHLLRGLGILSVILLASLTISGLHYYHMWRHTQEYGQLKEEVDRLRKENQTYRLTAKQLSDQISALQVTAQKLKIVAKSDLEGLGGVGGPFDLENPLLTEKDLLRYFRSLDRKRISLETELTRLQDFYTTRSLLLAATPALMPVKGYPSDRFGYRSDPFSGSHEFHPGVDISAPRGAKVVATADGLVVFSGRHYGYGKMVRIEHKFGISTLYGHLDRYTVEPGHRVKKGDIIGYVGSTGRSTGPHLHYEVRLNGQALNPFRFFRESL